jgi:hypothetical protein
MNGPDDAEVVHTPRRWVDNGWTAQVIKNEDDEGWAVAMTRHGESEPALTGPWTMGRDKKNPKPLDTNAFNTLVKTASEVIRRHEQQEHARLHHSVSVSAAGARWLVRLDIVPDDDDPHAMLSAVDADGQTAASVRVQASFKLSAASAERWVDSGFAKPA